MWRQGCRCRKLYVAATLSCSGGSGGNSFCNAKSCLFSVNCHRIGVMFSSRAHTAVFYAMPHTAVFYVMPHIFMLSTSFLM